MVMASKMSRRDFENSHISAQDTVGVAGDDIMFHILVLSFFHLQYIINVLKIIRWDPGFCYNTLWTGELKLLNQNH